ncbi:MAG: hypothetical protein IIZ06_01690 [Kiritimatiellae bacterium]|nr:hypothetical protein [Kiritimatiellia bacterium]
MSEDRRIDWDYELTDEDTKGGAEAVILPDGEYDAVVERLERGQFAGSQNMQAGPMAILTLAVDGGERGTARPKANVILNQKLAWKLDQLAISCGFWKKGEGKGRRIPWGEIQGRAIRVKLGHRVYQGKTYQEVERFLPPAEKADDGFDIPDEV